MRVQDEKIKGFNIIELLVVVVLIGIVSGLGYPSFTKWRLDREVRDSVFRIKSLIEGINAQVQRGQYVFVQVDVEEGALGDNEDGLIITSKGMGAKDFAPLLNDNESTWWVDEENRCNIDDTEYWTDNPDPDRNRIIDNDAIEVRQLILKKVSTSWTGNVGAVCFGKNERWFNGNGELVSGTGANAVVDNFLFICERTSQRTQCDIDPNTGNPLTEHSNLFAIEWSRFGNISIDKWYNGTWVNQ